MYNCHSAKSISLDLNPFGLWTKFNFVCIKNKTDTPSMDRPIKVKRSKCPKNTKVIVRQQNMITITENLFLRNKFEIKNKDMEKSYCFQNWNIAKLLKITKIVLAHCSNFDKIFLPQLFANFVLQQTVFGIFAELWAVKWNVKSAEDSVRVGGIQVVKARQLFK